MPVWSYQQVGRYRLTMSLFPDGNTLKLELPPSIASLEPISPGDPLDFTGYLHRFNGYVGKREVDYDRGVINVEGFDRSADLRDAYIEACYIGTPAHDALRDIIANKIGIANVVFDPPLAASNPVELTYSGRAGALIERLLSILSRYIYYDPNSDTVYVVEPGAPVATLSEADGFRHSIVDDDGYGIVSQVIVRGAEVIEEYSESISCTRNPDTGVYECRDVDGNLRGTPYDFAVKYQPIGDVEVSPVFEDASPPCFLGDCVSSIRVRGQRVLVDYSSDLSTSSTGVINVSYTARRRITAAATAPWPFKRSIVVNDTSITSDADAQSLASDILNRFISSGYILELVGPISKLQQYCNPPIHCLGRVMGYTVGLTGTVYQGVVFMVEEYGPLVRLRMRAGRPRWSVGDIRSLSHRLTRLEDQWTVYIGSNVGSRGDPGAPSQPAGVALGLVEISTEARLGADTITPADYLMDVGLELIDELAVATQGGGSGGALSASDNLVFGVSMSIDTSGGTLMLMDVGLELSESLALDAGPPQALAMDVGLELRDSLTLVKTVQVDLQDAIAIGVDMSIA